MTETTSTPEIKDVYDAVVVGSGPNGLAAAITLAQAGLKVVVFEKSETIGGGTRTEELTVPGLLHDICSAVHPLGVSSPFLSTLPLERHGLSWKQPPLALAHPLPNGDVGVLHQSIDDMVAHLGSDGDRWRSTFGPIAKNFDSITADILGPLLRVPSHPLAMARFGTLATQPTTMLANRFKEESTRALFAGIAAHIMAPLNKPFSASVGVVLTAAAHHKGWPVAEGGSSAITSAMGKLLIELGGEIATGVNVTNLKDLPTNSLMFLDTSPTAAYQLLGDRLPKRTRTAYNKWRYGPAAYKLDLAVREGIPWTNPECYQAGTIHLGGTIEHMVKAEQQVVDGELPERPFTLVAQQYLADPTRSQGDIHPVWVYAHVPHGYTGNATELIIDNIQQYAPNVRKHIVATHVTGPAAFEAYNPNYVGGDIATGASTIRQLLLRPMLSTNPYATGVPGVYLCSAATPPGAGVHGMCGHLAALRALKTQER